MEDFDKLQIGDRSADGRVQIIDEDRLCYVVRSESRGAYGVRTLSKQILGEFVEHFRQHPDSTSNEARDALSGRSNLDRFEYGYCSTLSIMAKMILWPDDYLVRLQIGDRSADGRVQIIDEDRLCYVVRSESRGAYGVRTLSKQLLGEFVEHFRQHPDSTSQEARDALCGHSDLDRYEYGYCSTLSIMAKMILWPDGHLVRLEAEPRQRSSKDARSDN